MVISQSTGHRARREAGLLLSRESPAKQHACYEGERKPPTVETWHRHVSHILLLRAVRRGSAASLPPWFSKPIVADHPILPLSSTTSSGHSGQLWIQHTIKSQSSARHRYRSRFRLSNSNSIPY